MTTVTDRALPVTGLHDGIDESTYHGDPGSLSSTGAKTLLYDGPRAYRWQRDHPIHKDAYDLGSVAHALILGVGDYTVLEHDSYRSKAAQVDRDQARADGRTPLLAKDYRVAEAIADAVTASPLAVSILAEGRPEVSMWATDPDTGVLMRGRVDWLRGDSIVDLKTSAKPTHPTEWAWTVRNYHYALQAAWYRRIHRLNTGDDLPFLWIAVDKSDDPQAYVHQPDPDLLADADYDVDRALHLYADCVATDTWPGLADDQQIHTTIDPRRNR